MEWNATIPQGRTALESGGLVRITALSARSETPTPPRSQSESEGGLPLSDFSGGAKGKQSRRV